MRSKDRISYTGIQDDEPKPMKPGELLGALTPEGIMKSEATGQVRFTFDETLPIKMDPGCKEALEKVGFVFGGVTDRIFLEAKFPPGWRKQPTSHSMWSNLLDDKGRKRGMIFFKAAFYDYDSMTFGPASRCIQISSQRQESQASAKTQ